ncbi:glycosyltransferase [Desulfococcus multivorans]|uniref:Glycosyl transferase group 1 n=1 Tax=Desulfococcus multivorans DSM 2059 TaxID=1121405 RepID=S7U5N1_DESML|nr:glycosyltransferase [Desulfococcus multivorans]EPR44811.1 glycosyl transferase group 1 [Desulfococcus multivorans DSM 2059]SKA29004.1 Glycosyltransferase involved in cell wall bisynthesis [Desulfococcus multivorans DSM 2059]
MQNLIWFDPVNNDPQFIKLIHHILKRHIDFTFVINPRSGFLLNGKIINFLPPNLSSKARKKGYLARLSLAVIYIISSIRALFLIFSWRSPVIFSTGMWVPIIDTIILKCMLILRINFHVLIHRPLKPGQNISKTLMFFYSSHYKYIVLSKFTKDYLYKTFYIPLKNISILPHPNFNIEYDSVIIDERLRSNLLEWKKDRNLFLYMSGIHMSHGILDLVEIIDQSRKRNLPYCFLLCGNPRNLEQSAISKRIEAKFSNTEFVKCSMAFYSEMEAKTWLSVATAVVLPYQEIAQSGVQALALGQGVPVIARNVGALPEQIYDGFNGIVVEDNSPETWFNAFSRLSEMKVDKSAIRKHSESMYGVEATINSFHDLMEI